MPNPRSRTRPAGTPGFAFALLLLALLLVLLSAAGAAAQTTTLHPGDSVRIAGAGYGVVRTGPGILVVRGPDGGEIEIPTPGLGRIDVLTRRTRLGELGRLTLAGGLIGGAFGALVGLGVPPERDCSMFGCFSRADNAMLGGMMVGVAGAGIGMVIGAVKPRGKYWRRIDPDRLALEVAPARDGATLGIRVRP